MLVVVFVEGEDFIFVLHQIAETLRKLNVILFVFGTADHKNAVELQFVSQILDDKFQLRPIRSFVYADEDERGLPKL